MGKNSLTLAIICSLLLLGCGEQSKKGEDKSFEASKPNIVYILADDLGYGDLGVYGQKKFSTPNIDKLAKQGLLFTQHYSGSTVCAPSRSALMTGMHTGHTPIRGNKSNTEEGQFPLRAEALTMAEVLKKVGYTTGAFGKWGLGFIGSEGDPNKQGFDQFYGYNCQGQAHRYYPTHLWDNEQKVVLDGNDTKHTMHYAPDLIHRKALDFIRSNADGPFFLYVPSVIPHAELIVPKDSIWATFENTFEEKPWGEDNSSGSRWKGNDYGSKDYHPKGYASQEKPRATFAAMVSRLDQQVGEIVLLLEQLGIEENTLVIFTSDNGPHMEGGADPNFFNSSGIVRGRKRDLYEGGIRVPMIAKWPGTIEPNRETDHISAFWDILPTLAELSGAEIPKNIDGISIVPTLKNTEGQQKHNHLYWEFHEQNGKQAVRFDDWKGVRLNVYDNPNALIELYNLSNDVKELQNVAGEHPEIVLKMETLMTTSRTDNPDFPFTKD
ncbi:arylsulfatase [Ulvibacterium sp.]|uniref:arylsulfatase n=1 Tax=Ulvibacterium sp. TaxID=2665914 RepID=UPI00262E7F32|nr:arylsulfatase [Ulvibacterium sp.]